MIDWKVWIAGAALVLVNVGATGSYALSVENRLTTGETRDEYTMRLLEEIRVDVKEIKKHHMKP